MTPDDARKILSLKDAAEKRCAVNQTVLDYMAAALQCDRGTALRQINEASRIVEQLARA